MNKKIKAENFSEHLGKFVKFIRDGRLCFGYLEEIEGIIYLHQDCILSSARLSSFYKYSIVAKESHILEEVSKETQDVLQAKKQQIENLTLGQEVWSAGRMRVIDGSEERKMIKGYDITINTPIFFSKEDMYSKLIATDTTEYYKNKLNEYYRKSVTIPSLTLEYITGHFTVFLGLSENTSMYEADYMNLISKFFNIKFPRLNDVNPELLNVMLKEASDVNFKTWFTKDFEKQLSYMEDNAISEQLINNEEYHRMQYVDFNIIDQMIEYTPHGKELLITEDNTIASKNRQSIKPHKFFNTLLKDKFTEYEIKTFVDKFVAMFTSYEVKYFRGAKFAENYSKVNTRGWTTTSCMDRKARNFFELYTQPPFRLGVIYREGEIVGRFIEVTADGNFVYNDRLYYKDELTLGWYNSWVDKNKLTRKNRNSHESKSQFYNVEKGVFDKTIQVTLKRNLDSFSVYPYIDTLSWGEGKVLRNYDDQKSTFRFLHTQGRCERIRCKLDVVTNQYITDDLAVHIDFGKHSGGYTITDNLFFSAENGGHCLK